MAAAAVVVVVAAAAAVVEVLSSSPSPLFLSIVVSRKEKTVPTVQSHDERVGNVEEKELNGGKNENAAHKTHTTRRTQDTRTRRTHKKRNDRLSFSETETDKNT